MMIEQSRSEDCEIFPLSLCCHQNLLVKHWSLSHCRYQAVPGWQLGLSRFGPCAAKHATLKLHWSRKNTTTECYEQLAVWRRWVFGSWPKTINSYLALSTEIAKATAEAAACVSPNIRLAKLICTKSKLFERFNHAISYLKFVFDYQWLNNLKNLIYSTV